MRQEFGVAMAAERVALDHQVGAHLRIIEQLAVEDDGDAAVLVALGLLAIEQADDAEPAIGELQSGPLEEAVLVRAAMEHGPRHAPHDHRIDRRLLTQMQNARDAAHSGWLVFGGKWLVKS